VTDELDHSEEDRLIAEEARATVVVDVPIPGAEDLPTEVLTGPVDDSVDDLAQGEGENE
jgi:hypothetical protein